MNNIPPSESELRMMQQMTGNDLSSSSCNFDLRRIILPSIAFFILSLNYTDEAIVKLYKMSSGMLLAVKIIVFVVILILAQLLGLA